MGNNIKELRLKKELSQSELARRLGVTRGYICKVESGKKTPNLRLSLRIANVLDCSLDDLFLPCLVTY